MLVVNKQYVAYVMYNVFDSLCVVYINILHVCVTYNEVTVLLSNCRIWMKSTTANATKLNKALDLRIIHGMNWQKNMLINV